MAGVGEVRPDEEETQLDLFKAASPRCESCDWRGDRRILNPTCLVAMRDGRTCQAKRELDFENENRRSRSKSFRQS